MTATRPPYQLELDLPMPGRGEAARLDWQEVEAVTAMAELENPAPTEHLMEAICDSDNIEAALRALPAPLKAEANQQQSKGGEDTFPGFLVP